MSDNKSKWFGAVRLKSEYFNNEVTKIIKNYPNGIEYLFSHLEMCVSAKEYYKSGRYFYSVKGVKVDTILSSIYGIGNIEAFKEVMSKYDLIEFYDDYMIIHKYWQGSDRNRNSLEYRLWRKEVFDRDNYECQNCGVKARLNAHHIIRWVDDESKRFDIANGVTLCEDCHREEHRNNG